MLIGLWGCHSLMDSQERLCASLTDLMLVFAAAGGEKVFLGVLERSVKAPQAKQAGQDNTLAWC